VCLYLVGVIRILKFLWPSVTHQQPHQQRDGQRITKMIEKSDGQETKNERRGCAPEPEVLMQHVKRDDGKGE
jgi:hypothetical protein